MGGTFRDFLSNVVSWFRYGRLQQGIAWSGTIVLLTWLVATTDLTEVWRAMQEARMAVFLGAVVLFSLVLFCVDTLTTRFFLERAGISISRGEFLRIRGASYLLNFVNYALALGMMATLVSRSSGKPLKVASSPFLLLSFVDLAILSLIVLTVLAAGYSPFDSQTTRALLLLAAGILAGGFVILSATRGRALPGWLEHMVPDGLLESFRAANPLDLLLMGMLRAGYIALDGLATVVFLSTFGFKVPFSSVLVFESILSFVALLPVSVGGIGSTQVVMRDLYATFSASGLDPVPAVDAYSSATIFALETTQILIGLWCLRAMMKRLNSSISAPEGNDLSGEQNPRKSHRKKDRNDG